jgi:cell division protein FtsN
VSDEGFREIQLNGKQLIFLFMAVTVVSVVIFLFGVLVGRGVREGAATTEIAGGEVAPDSGARPGDDAAWPPVASSASQAPAAPATEELSYPDRLLRDTPAEEKLKTSARSETAAAPAPIVQEPVAEKTPAPPPPAVNEKAPAPAAEAPEPRTVPPTSVPAPAAAAQASDPSGPGFAVQVAAYRDRRDADTLAKQLAAKGYPAFVMDPVKGTSTTLFRVRVGKYKTLKDAEAIEVRLQTAEQLTNAWIAR